MLTEPFVGGKEVLNKIEKFQHQAYFVGGCVRDLLLSRPIGDIDIATSALPQQIQNIFPKVILVGIEHGTVIVRHNHISYEVTTFRLDGTYTDQRRPDSVQFIEKIDEDLKRRDFTINALAMNQAGDIIDLFNGRNDLKNKVIRTVGNGYERFTEDPLRIIRALRFSSQLGFLIEKQTLINIDKVKEQIETLSIERITNEFTKLFSGDYIKYGIMYLKSTRIDHYLPLLKENPHIIAEFPENIAPLRSFGEVIAHFHCLDPAIEIIAWVKAWKCSNLIKREATQLIKALYYFKQNGFDQWLIYQLDNIYYGGFLRLIHHFSLDNKHLQMNDLLKAAARLPIQSRQEVSVNGNDIIKLFPELKSGPWIKQILLKIEEEIVFGRLENHKKMIKEWIICNPPIIN